MNAYGLLRYSLVYRYTDDASKRTAIVEKLASYRSSEQALWKNFRILSTILFAWMIFGYPTADLYFLTISIMVWLGQDSLYHSKAIAKLRPRLQKFAESYSRLTNYKFVGFKDRESEFSVFYSGAQRLFEEYVAAKKRTGTWDERFYELLNCCLCFDLAAGDQHYYDQLAERPQSPVAA